MTRITPALPPLRHTAKNVVDPGDYVAIVGKSFLTHERRPLLTIGTRTWSRWSLGRLGCPHPLAATSLNRVVQELGITSMSSLAAHVQELGTYKGLGVTAYWIVLAILRESGYDVEAVHGQNVSYQTVKDRSRHAAEAQRKREAPRHRRRDKAPYDEDVAAASAARALLKAGSGQEAT